MTARRFFYNLANYLYPLDPLPTQRTKQLTVLALGLPRSGTDSLHKALKLLGYDDVAHGFDWWLNHPHISRTYWELALLREQDRLPSPATMRTDFFDRVLSDYEATTDVPTVWFAHELLAAYPDAKVILNRRKDVLAWKASFRQSVLPMMQGASGWRYWFASWFEPALFWGVGLTAWLHGQWLFRGDFEAHAEDAYVQHYEKLEKALEASGRPCLKWGVEDGWEPLCAFLGKPIPSEPFPNGNTAAEFLPKLMVVDKRRFQKAQRNAWFVGALVTGAMTAALVLLR